MVATMPCRFHRYIRFVLLFSLSLYLDSKQSGDNQTTFDSKYYSQTIGPCFRIFIRSDVAVSTTARPPPRPRGPLPAVLPAFAAAHTYQEIVKSNHAQFKPILSQYTEDEQKVLKRFRQVHRKRVRRWLLRAPIFPTIPHH